MAILQNTTVSGSLVITGDLTARQFILSSSVTFYTESFSSGSTRFGDSPDDFMRVTGSLIISSSLGVSLFASGSSGSVGIGTNSPAAKLHVVGLTGGTRGGATSIPALGFTNSSSVALFTNFDTNYGTLFGTLNTGTGWIQQGRTDGTGTAYNLALQPSGGLVGIGTTAPIGTNGTEQTLHLNSGAANYATLYVTNGANSVKAIVATQSTELLGIFGMQSNHPALFVTNDIERMRIDSSGGILFRGGTTGINGVYLANDSSLFKLYAGDSAVSVKGFAFYVTNGSTQPEAMRITSGGNVGIGMTGYSDMRLAVRGAGATSATFGLRIESSAANALFQVRNDGLIETGTQSGSPYNNTSGAAANLVVNSSGTLERSTSSLKYKTDIVNYDKGLAEVLKMRPVYYKSINEREKDLRFAGLIAEEIEGLGLTEFVQYAEDGTPDALAYSHMVTLAFKAIQELKAENDSLKEILTRNNIS